MEQADVIIVGSGQGGNALASELAQLGRYVVIFERERWGGNCINWGCIPSKALLAAAHAAGAARHAQQLGISATVEVDFPAVMRRVRDIVQERSSNTKRHIAEMGARVITAEAAFVAPHAVRGGGVTFEAPTVVINTGKAPRVLDIPGLAVSPYLTYKSIWRLDRRPAQMIVMGGGYTGVEFAQALQRLGTQVTVIEQAERLVPDESEAVAGCLRRALESDGVELRFGGTAAAVDYRDERFTVTLDNDDTVEAEELLLSVGRRPNVQALDLERAGIEQDEQGHIRVDEQFQTSIEGVYAIGDVTGQPAFTHVSWEDHRRLLDILTNEKPQRTRGDRALGYAFFTEPQVGRAGLSLREAREQGFMPKEATLDLAQVGRAELTGYDNGFYQMVVDDETDRILGATLVGPAAAELVHVFITLMEAGATWQKLAAAQHIHPSYAEDLPTLARRFQSS